MGVCTAGILRTAYSAFIHSEGVAWAPDIHSVLPVIEVKNTTVAFNHRAFKSEHSLRAHPRVQKVILTAAGDSPGWQKGPEKCCQHSCESSDPPKLLLLTPDACN